MSNREMVIDLLRNVPEYKMGYVLAYLQGITADENADDTICAQMLADYRADPDPEKAQRIPLDECKREWGLA